MIASCLAKTSAICPSADLVLDVSIVIGGRVNSLWLQAPATRRIAGFLLCRENCREQFLKLQIKAVASP